MEFSIENFVASPTVEELLTLRTADLLLVVDCYKVPVVRSNMRKTETLNQTIRWLVDEENVPHHALRNMSVNLEDRSQENVEIRLKELELKRQGLSWSVKEFHLKMLVRLVFMIGILRVQVLVILTLPNM